MTAGDEIFVPVDMKAVISKVITSLSMSERVDRPLAGPRNGEIMDQLSRS